MADVSEAGPGEEGRGRGVGGRQLDWSRRIGEALKGDLFVLHGQPIVDIRSGETVRHELFLRMVERRRLIPAGDFVLAAEELGSIREIDRWVVGRSIEIAAAGHPVDLNLSVQSADDELLDLIRRKIDETGADPSYLVLELNEEQLLGDFESGEGFVCAVHELGCGIALDGFIQGGRSSFLLKRVPIDFVKLGARFIDGLTTDGRRRRKATNAVVKAHRNGQRAIAHGVEDLVTLQLLQELSINEAQGNALGPPGSIESLLGAPA
jgi:EAL domain-containing protein (putative c-di-GMP-specific phosphodiesterase class I)